MMKRKVDFSKVLCGVFLLLLTILLLISLCAAEIAPHDPLKIQYDIALQGPSAAFPFGTDDFGRCVFSRILYGMRSSLFMSLLIVGISLAIGTTAGIVSGYFGGWVDDCIMRLTDMFLAFPGMVFSIAVVGVLGVGWGNTAIALILPGWLIFARLSRGLVLTVKEKEYLRSAKAAGLTTFQIMRRYILPNIAQQLVIIAAIEIGSTLISFCALTYLGMGAQPPEPELGLMLSEAKSKMQIAPWMMFFPCLTVFVIVILFQLLSDALRDVLDPSRAESGQSGAAGERKEGRGRDGAAFDCGQGFYRLYIRYRASGELRRGGKERLSHRRRERQREIHSLKIPHRPLSGGRNCAAGTHSLPGKGSPRDEEKGAGGHPGAGHIAGLSVSRGDAEPGAKDRRPV